MANFARRWRAICYIFIFWCLVNRQLLTDDL
jgi:hypothetical protein